MARRKNSDPSVSPFLGIGEGKAKAAAAAAAVAVEAAKRETMMQEQLAALAGANVAAQKAAAEASVIAAKAAAEASASAGTLAVTKAESGTGVYYIVAGIVLILMAGLYFIIKARKK